MAKSDKKLVAYEKITQEIIDALNKGIIPWKKPWNVIGGAMPMNVANKKYYQGINVLILGSKDFESNVWGTYKQWSDKKGFVRKGEKGSTICYWNFFPKRDKDGNVEYDAKGREKKIPFLKHFTVFNACQIDGITLADYIPEKPESNEFTPIEQAEQVVKEMPLCPPITHHGSRACYAPLSDEVTMPPKEQFHSNGEYYSVLFHELSHSTGHDSRIGRSLDCNFGNESYSKEELIAEISACFLCSHCGIEQTFDNSTAYIQGWLKKLKNDPKFIVQAASGAKKSTEFILNNNN